MNLTRSLTALFSLCKIKIVILASLSTILGYILHAGKVSYFMLVPFTGVVLLASGSAALNEYQERKFDAVMKRTKKRPIPLGLIKPENALKIAVFLIAAGELFLLLFCNILPAFLGFLAILLYNLMYTKLKRISAIAVIPGSFIGTIPPLIGWTADKGSMLDIRILFISLFFFLWQVPHFWLLLLKYHEEYKEAGFPSILDKLNCLQVSRMIFIWIFASISLCTILPLFRIPALPVFIIPFILSGFVLFFLSYGLLVNKVNIGIAFKAINIYAIIFIIIISIDKILI